MKSIEAETVITEDDFVIGLMRGLAERGYTGMMPPELDRATAISDKAAVETFRLLEERFPDITVKFFFTYKDDPVAALLGYPQECLDWQRKLHELGSFLFKVDTYNGLLRFNTHSHLYRDDRTPPGDPAVWDVLTRHFEKIASPVLSFRR